MEKFHPYFYKEVNNVDEKTFEKYLHILVQRQDIIIEQISALSTVLAKHLDLPIEEGECEYINDVE